ncbi:MAG: hypothetical protein ACRDT8_19270 [Micromonosporaceae bacterium]
MGKSRYYIAGTKEALFCLSRGTCYWPECGRRVVSMTESGQPRVDVQVAHIRGLHDGEARHEPLPDRVLNSFANLMLMCQKHHTEVDSEFTRHLYGTEKLEGWKLDREGGFSTQFSELVAPQDNDELKSLMVDAVQQAKEDILEPLHRLLGVSDEVREMVAFLTQQAFDAQYLDPDAMASLEAAARALRHLEDFAPMLAESAHSLSGMPDYVPMLSESSHNLSNLPDDSLLVHQAADKFANFANHVEPLQVSAQKLEGMKATLSRFSEAVARCEEIERSASSLERATSRASQLRSTAAGLERAVGQSSVPTTIVNETFSWKVFGLGVIAASVGAVVVLIAPFLW